MDFACYFQQAATEYGLAISPEQIADCTVYYEMLLEWNQKINLTAITEPQEVAVKHMIDSLSCYNESIFPAGCSVIDVGTGAGFPGLPLKIWRPDIKLTLLDSLNKRVTFLQNVVDQLQLNDVAVVHCRAEDGGKNKLFREKFNISVSRAVARLNILCELCLPFVAIGGYFVALKGAQYRQEADEAKRAIELLGGEAAKIQPVKLPGLDDSRAVIYIKKVKPTPAAYPRRPGQPEKKPL